MEWIKKKRKNVLYCSETIKLDIETAWNHKEDNPVCWMVSCQIMWLGEVYIFRDPLDVMKWYNDLIPEYELTHEKRIITIIHNASFDLSYLLPYIRKYIPDDHKYGIFDSPNKCIMYRQSCFEWRCTWRLTNESLHKWSQNMRVDHVKQIGMYDYSRVLYQDSKLSAKDLKYDRYDVLSMAEAFEKQLAIFKDNITSVPLTSTGYIRRILRRATRKDPYYRQNFFWDNQLSHDQINMCFNAFAGGYCHTNRFKKGRIIKTGKKKGKHRDFRSGYPSKLRCELLPWGRPIDYYDINNPIHRMVKMDVDKVLSLTPEYFTITKIHIYNMALKDKSISMPFMQVSKMFERSWVIEKKGKRDKVKQLNYLDDNGRLLNLISGHFVTYVDGYMLQILKEQYKFQYIIEKVTIYKNMPLPNVFIEPIDTLFKQKSDLKKEYHELRDKLGEFHQDTISKRFELDQCKKLLNSIYGCFVTSPLRVNYMDNDNPHVRSKEEQQKELLNYYHNMNNFLPYQVGVAITALQRFELYEYIKTIGYENVLYADTDSLFYLSDPEIEARVEALNAEKQKKAAYVIDDHGEKIYYDVFEEEPDWIGFKALHSKCYGVIDSRNELKVTIAGVPERTMIGVKRGAPIYLTREEELSGIKKTAKLRGEAPDLDPWKGLDNLEDDFIFKTNAGISCKYVNHFMGKQVVNGHTVETAGGAVIIPLKEKIIKDNELVEGFDYYIEYNSTEGVIDND